MSRPMTDAPALPALLQDTPLNHRRWLAEAVHYVEADFNRSADTHLFKLQWSCFPGIDIYLKDESTHPTGSLKHRLARSLFLYSLCNGWIRPGAPIVEASSGSTAVSEAYFAKLLGLPFIAVVPRCTSGKKLEKIRFYGGEIRLVDDPREVYAESERLAQACGGHFMDQFTYAERATDWRGNNNIADAIFSQMRCEAHPVPAWIVCGAGTGGTSATLGRYVRYRGFATQICVVDPENSVFYDYYRTGNAAIGCPGKPGRIEGIGRPRVEASFIRSVIDHMVRVPDAASMAALRLLEQLLGKKCGGSTGTNFYGVLQLAHAMHTAGEQGSIVTLICDPGERYLQTYFNDCWLQQQGWDIAPYSQQLDTLMQTGVWEALPLLH